jgi:hypothetical protein
MPSQGVGWAKFVPSLEDIDAKMNSQCRTCFGIKNDLPAENSPDKPFQVFVKGSPVIINGIVYTEETNPANEKETPTNKGTVSIFQRTDEENEERIRNGLIDLLKYEENQTQKKEGSNLVEPQRNPEVNPSEDISETGRLVLQIVADNKSKAKYQYPGNTYGWLGDPIIPDFGDLNDPDTPCKLVINDYYTPDTSSDGDFNETGKDILFFDKKMTVKALSEIKPGEWVTVKGLGRVIHFKEKGGWSYNRNVDNEKEDVNNNVEVVLKMYVAPVHEDRVTFEFSSKSLNPLDTFVINHRMHLDK